MSRRRGGSALLIIIAMAMVLGGPILLLGAPATDSGFYNWNWAEQFAGRLAHGDLLPRWLPDAFGGLGSPTFVFYAPLPFYLTAPLFWLAGGVMDANRILGIAQVLMLAASGLAMHRWLLPRADRRMALAGALFYMTAPYHLFDLYVRGSIGEIAAYALLPVFMAALDRTLRGGVTQAPWLAATTAMLLLSHLPSALLIGVFLAVPYIAFATIQQGRGGIGHAATAIAAGSAGLVLAAFHVVPAVTMTTANAFDAMAQGHFEAARWLLLHPDAWASTGYMTFVAAASIAIVAAALTALLSGRRAGGSDRLFWAGATLLGLALMAGIIPALWSSGSPLARVQFPWRMLVILEFAGVTALCIGAARLGRLAAGGLVALCALAGAPAFFVLAAAATPIQRLVTDADWRQGQRDLGMLRPDPGEYLPANHWLAHTAAGRADIDHVGRIVASVGRDDLAWGADGGDVSVTTAIGPRCGLRLATTSGQGGLVVIRRFHFPAWSLVNRAGGDALHGEPHGPDRLLSFRIPPGEHAFDLTWRATPVERLSMIASALGWLLWLAAILACRWRRPRGIGATPHPT